MRRSLPTLQPEEVFNSVLGLGTTINTDDCIKTVRDRIMAGEMLLTPEEIDELKQTFIDLDDNNDGMIDNEELVVLFNSLNIVCADDDIKLSG
ncbi:hypothetical protein ACHWQZ_G009640 [Mnemiopsis leidyi]